MTIRELSFKNRGGGGYHARRFLKRRAVGAYVMGDQTFEFSATSLGDKPTTWLVTHRALELRCFLLFMTAIFINKVLRGGFQ